MQNTQAALIWISSLLNALKIPFQIAGGLAARLYGVDRPLVDIDIDIPESCFSTLKSHVAEYLIAGPEQWRDNEWDLLLMTLNYKGQLIDLSGSEHTKLFDRKSGEWLKLVTDFSKSIIMEIYGIKIPVIPRADLIAYKTRLAREVDDFDVAALRANSDKK